MMETTSLTLTVFFDDPFWVGVFERADGGRLSVCRVVFGAEPRDAEVLALVLRRAWAPRHSRHWPVSAKPAKWHGALRQARPARNRPPHATPPNAPSAKRNIAATEPPAAGRTSCCFLF